MLNYEEGTKREQTIKKNFGEDRSPVHGNPYLIIKALEDGVRVMGLTRGLQTKVSHTEILSSGEIIVCQLTEYTSAFKIVGRAQVITPYGEIQAEGVIPKLKEFKEKIPEF
ncbi:MAG: trp RNA-binding attenuation protein MtrB [Candidatus Hydrothermales bacterium]